MTTRLSVLGGGGWLPAHGRHTACALLSDGTTAVMIDAGTGVARLRERPELLAGHDRLDIILTHFHLDHIAGLAYLPALERGPETTIWGPGALLYDTSTEQLLARVSNEPFHPLPLEEQAIPVRDIPSGPFELPGFTLTTRRQDRHSAPTLGLRFDDTLAWITDTAFEDESARFAAGCAVLAHEVWFVAAAPRNPDIHTSALDAATVALRAGVEDLLLIHLPPFQSDLAGLEAEAQEVATRARLAADGLEIVLDADAPAQAGATA